MQHEVELLDAANLGNVDLDGRECGSSSAECRRYLGRDEHCTNLGVSSPANPLVGPQFSLKRLRGW